MKKICLILLAVLVLPYVANAQQKGEAYIGGSFGVVAGTDNLTTFGFSLQGGGFVIDKLRLDGNIDFQTAGGVNALVFGPSVAYYIRLADRFYYTPTFEIAALYASAGYGGVMGAGLDLHLFEVEFRPIDHFAMGVNLASFTWTSLEGINSTNFGLMLSPSVSLRYYF